MSQTKGVTKRIGLLLLVSLCLLGTACQGEEKQPNESTYKRKEAIKKKEERVSISVSDYVEQARDARTKSWMDEIKVGLQIKLAELQASTEEEDVQLLALVDKQYCNHIVELKNLLLSEDAFAKAVKEVLEEYVLEERNVEDIAIKIGCRKMQSKERQEYQVTVLQRK